MISDRLLRQYLAEALDPPRLEEVRTAIAASAGVRERLALLLATTVEEEPPQWVLPPPQAAAPFTLWGHLQPGAVMDGHTDEGWVELSFEVPRGLESHVVVVLERREGDWAVLFPVNDGEVLTAADLPSPEPGRRRLDVTTTGTHDRVGILLVPETPSFDEADPWRTVRDMAARGQLRVVTFDV